jgi:hypothetical protein
MNSVYNTRLLLLSQLDGRLTHLELDVSRVVVEVVVPVLRVLKSARPEAPA